MQPDHVFLATLFWSFLIFLTHGLEECHTYEPSHCKEKSKRCFPFNGDNTTIICCNLVEDFLMKETLAGKNIKHLYVYNASMDTLALQSKCQIETLTITGGNIKNFSLSGTIDSINCLNLSNNHLINVTLQDSMPRLRIMDLSKNNLTGLPDKLTMLRLVQNVTLDISGNNGILCTNVEWLLNTSTTVQLRNINDTICSLQKSFNWFDSEFQIYLLHLRSTQCEEIVQSHGCRCGLFRYIPPTEFQSVLILLNVNCSNLQLKELPSHLPPNTFSLDVSNNNISSLGQMKESSYSAVRILHAQNNSINTISDLEGTAYLSNFSLLDIRGNNLTTVPTYFLSNRLSLDRNIATVIRLGGNKLMCDCNTAQNVKVWLSFHKKYVMDYEEIGCRNLPKTVMQLEQHDVCVTSRKWTDYIYYIIAGEVTLLIFLISKVSYDYWVFKTAGYLPWPASKMPKLPCDWVFET